MPRVALRVTRLRALPVLAGLVLLAPADTRAEHGGSASVYVRDDTNDTLVVSPRLKLRAPIQEATHVDLAYTVDVWTSASVDIIASASQPVTEQRDELTVGLDHVLGDVTLAGSYRYSTEPDYESHGGGLNMSWNLADNAATLALSAGGSADQVGRAGDQGFAEEVGTLTAGGSFTQVLDTKTLVQLLYDFTYVRGYQASAYRFIALGGDGTCTGTARYCVPEQNPRLRMRHAVALRGRRALSSELSVGAGYRFYLDDWGLLSHTAQGDLAWAPTMQATLALSYRFYTQGAADHYRARYLEGDIGRQFFTRDKELSPLTSHRVGLELDWLWELPGGGSDLLTALEVAPTFYQYSDFQLLDQITAIEATAVLGMEFQ